MKISKNLKIKSWLLLSVFITEIFMPTLTFALTSGPSQPEVHSFEPVTTNQMVDLFSGDFTYNIPLLTVPGPNGGYPINIAYHSGIGMEQEASWVGLGWNLSPGVINREMRGIPDDFNNAKILKRQYTKTNRTYSIGADAFSGFEAFGLDFDIGVGMSVMYNNYKGVGIGANFSTTSSVALGTTTVGLSNNLNFDPYSGLGYSPSISLSKNYANSKSSITFDVGVQFHAIEGYQGYSTGVNFHKTNHVIKGGPEKYKVDPGRVKRKINKRSLKNMLKNKSRSRAIQSGIGAGISFRAASTFMPSGEFPTKSKSITLSLKPGGSGLGLFAKTKFDATYSENKLYYNSKTFSAFGFMNLEHSNDKSLIDFNRESRVINRNTRFLPFPNATYDIFQVKGQGIGGVFKPFRSEEVLLHEAGYQEASGEGGSLDTEIGAGLGMHIGEDVYFTSNELTNETIDNAFGGEGKNNDKPFYEPFYFKASGELASSRPILDEKRAPRVQHMAYRTIKEMENSPRYKTPFYSNYNTFINSDVQANLADQIGELTVFGAEGSKYVYGIPAYNNSQIEYTTAISSTEKSNFDGVDIAKVTQAHFTNGNGKGTDEFFSESRMPKYAYSYLLSNVLSHDYVDLTNNGPSEDDLGYYVHFKYNKNSNDFKWKSPFLFASYSESKINLKTDDKGSITYGNKEVYYMESVETKTHIAKFTFSDRADAYESSGLISDETNPIGTSKSQKLDRIDLYSKLDQTIPIKTVHFEYDYTLCNGVYNHVDYVPLSDPNDQADDGTGKLTLKKIYFTNGNSVKGTLNPYTFQYSDFNPDYSQQCMDRWGNYKPRVTNGISSKKSPYVRQDNNLINDEYAKAWNLSTITLPSGGDINVAYESDDYQFVQDKDVMQMMTVTDINYATGQVFFKYHPDQLSGSGSSIKDYFEGVDDLYFKVYNKLKDFPIGHPNKTSSNTVAYDYVEGYGSVNHERPIVIESTANHIASFYVKGVSLKNRTISPFQQAAIHKLKLERSDVLTNPPLSDNGGLSIIEGIAFSINFFGEQLETLIAGYLNYAYDEGYGSGGDFSNPNYPSFIRLKVPNGLKYGGGSRIKSIEVVDHWGDFTSNQEASNFYGKKYIYKLEDGSSSGVAENEPVFGDEESPFRQPFRSTINDVLLNDEILSDRSIASSAMPSAGIGYSRVIEKSIKPVNSETGSGQVVSEFYTAKEYPFYSHASKRTKQINGPTTYTNFPVGGVTKDFQTYSQHYTINTNDMHGKAKRTTKYKTEDVLYTNGAQTYADIPFYERSTTYYHNNNNVTALNGHQSGGVTQLGVTTERYKDTKSFQSFTEGYGGQINTDAVVLPFVPGPIIVPTGYPRLDYTNKKFKSTVTTEISNRNAILDRVVLERDGSQLVTQNEVFDQRTGIPIITSTNNEFGDKIYEYNIPGHWYYPTMGNASKNDRAGLSNIPTSEYTVSGQNLTLHNIDKDKNIFIEGDQVEVTSQNLVYTLWVNQIHFNGFTDSVEVDLGTSNGGSVSGIIGDIDLMVVESGNKNLTIINTGYMKYKEDKSIPLLDYLSDHTYVHFEGNIADGHVMLPTYSDPTNSLHLEIANLLNPIRIPNNPCELSGTNWGTQGHAYAFFHVEGAYIANANAQILLDNVVSPNSLTFFNSAAEPSTNNTVLSIATKYNCSAEIIFPDTFVTDFQTSGGASSMLFGSLLNYTFEYQGDNDLLMTVSDGNSMYKYDCIWNDPLGCYDACIMPLNVSATVFEDDWSDEYVGLNNIIGENGITLDDTMINPYRYGLKNVWRPKRDYVFQVARTQSGNQGENTNIRHDGVYSDFSFFNWNNPEYNTNWTWTTEMTKYSPYGFNLEVSNVLGLKSSQLVGYNNSLVMATAQNANYFEIASENFEEQPTGSVYSQGSGHINLTPITGSLSLENNGHTGSRSLKGISQFTIPVVTSSKVLDQRKAFSVIENKAYILSFWARDGQVTVGSGTYETNPSIYQGSNVISSVNINSVSVDGWRKYELEFTPVDTNHINVKFSSNNGSLVVVDDIRVHPFQSSMETYIYDPHNYRYLAELDGQNMATFYTYDQEGKLTQVKKETTRGVQTLKSTQAHLKIQNQ